ncbi:MAG: type II secretion system inner membrane protein GspF [Gammaproteobacteria bacterium]|nr:type II secretion system inner membrane protein GspF [Gammaproteobacteria bacterium]
MAAFEYKAFDGAGKEKKGLLEGDTARQVRRKLREQQLMPIEVREVAQQNNKETSHQLQSSRNRLSTTELALLTRQLATMLKAGTPLDESLQAVAEQSEAPKTKRLLLGVRSRVMEGHSLADGFSSFPNAFPEIYRSSVGAGEQSGHLDSVLEHLAEYTEKQHAIRQKVLLAFLYPSFLTIVAVGIVGFLMVSIVPKLVDIFADIEQELPFITTALIAISDFLQNHGLIMIVAIVAVIVALRLIFRNEGPKRKLHTLFLRLPLMGRFIRSNNTAQFANTLSMMAASGVPILTALHTAGSVITNLPMREAVEAATVRVREGASIGKSLSMSKLFPPMTMHLIKIGEASGELEEMLGRAAENQERELDTMRTALTSLMGPMMILIMGGIVVLIVLAILLPIMSLNDLTA